MSDEQKISNIKLNDDLLRDAIEWRLKAWERAHNTAFDEDLKNIYKRRITTLRQSLNTINQLELIPSKQK